MAREAGEDAPSMAWRYLHNTVTWNSAMYYIVAGTQSSSSFKDISLDFIITPLASPGTCVSEGPLIDFAIKHMLMKLDLECESKEARSLIEEFKMKVNLPLKFRGTVHCEALLMGMVVAYQDNATPLPDGVRREELELFKVV